MGGVWVYEPFLNGALVGKTVFEELTTMSEHDEDLRAVALAYIQQREEGVTDYPAFVAAVDAYRKRHPETSNGEAALIVSNLMQEMPRAHCA